MKFTFYHIWKHKDGQTLVLLIVMGVFFRLYHLGEAAFRADTILFLNICSRAIPAGEIFHRWIEWMGICGQFPFPMVWIKGFLNVLHLDPSPFTIRLPSAIWGILTIPVAYLAGRILCGSRVGWLFAALAALQPMMIQATREAYYYPPLLLGSMLLLAGLSGLFRGLSKDSVWPRWVYVVYPVGFFLAIYSQPSGWPVALLHILIPAAAWIWLLVRRHRFYRPLFILLAVCGIVGLPMLFVDWGLPAIQQTTSAPIREYARRVFGESGGYPLFFFKTLVAYGWGETPMRVGLTLVVLAASIFGLAIGLRRQYRLWVVPYLLLGGAVLFVFGQRSSGATLSPRYLIASAPVYLLLLAVGMDRLLTGVESARRIAGSAKLRLFAAGSVLIGAFIPAAWTATQLTGQPTPYKDIVRWMDTHLPSGTPVLVDRWFEPWNELKVYNSTNVCFTFTIPNEPADVYLKHNWRQTAEQFFEKYPDAAYLEIAKSYWENPDIGPWNWPRQHFKQHVILRNEAGLKLRGLGLLYREDGGIYTNRLIVEIFYNTPEDVMAKAKVEGRQVIALYGPGWGYIKPGWQNGDFRDWRVLKGRATMDIYNLNTQPRTITVRITGVAAGGTKHVRIGTQILDCEADRLMEWNLAPITLQPGLNALVWQDARWDRGAQQVPLLVDGFTVNVVDKSE